MRQQEQFGQPAQPAAGSPTEPAGVSFPVVDGRMSSTATCRELLADAAAAADPALELEIRATADWRRDYASHLRALTQLSADAGRSLDIAEAGLESMRARIRWTDERSEPITLKDALAEAPQPAALSTGTFTGTAEPIESLRIPYKGGELAGAELVDQLAEWVRAGTIEPSAAERIAVVADHPEWLSLPGRTVALIGAGSEIGPFAPLCAWGADVAVLDVPSARVWERIRTIADAGAGTVHVPLAADGKPGVDLLASLPDATAWLAELPAEAPLALGMHAYADGGPHVLLSAAFDALSARLIDDGRADALAYLATPTDSYVVPADAARQARDRFAHRRARRAAQAPLRLITAGRAFSPAYSEGAPVADALIIQQGPNYALAKRLQRWQGIASRAAGTCVSFNVAPATGTRSVTRNRVLAAAYAGAHLFGIEIFAPETTRALMAALLVYDLQQPPAPDGEPEALFMEGAAHGGLWRAAYEPRSVLPLAALAGLPAALHR
jgi:hypothetical protein